MEVIEYVTPDGRNLYGQWIDSLRDMRAVAAIDRRLRRIATTGHFGDYRYLRNGVSEPRIDVGAGYRIYFARFGNDRMLVLLGGDKRQQNLDIERAMNLWTEFRSRIDL